MQRHPIRFAHSDCNQRPLGGSARRGSGRSCNLNQASSMIFYSLCTNLWENISVERREVNSIPQTWQQIQFLQGISAEACRDWQRSSMRFPWRGCDTWTKCSYLIRPSRSAAKKRRNLLHISLWNVQHNTEIVTVHHTALSAVPPIEILQLSATFSRSRPCRGLWHAGRCAENIRLKRFIKLKFFLTVVDDWDIPRMPIMNELCEQY